MSDQEYSQQDIQNRLAIEDLYDRQIAASEQFDFDSYDTTFSVDAYIDLSDFGIAACSYPEYRTWLAGLKDTIISAQRVRGGLRLQLAGDTASTHIPVTCHVLMRTEKKPKLTHVGIYYRDVLEKNDQGWRIISRKEELSWSS